MVLYELLDELLGFGYQQTTEGAVLKKYITQERSDSAKAVVPSAVTNVVYWRTDFGIRYKKNEVFLDITESVDLLAYVNGTVVQSEVTGSVRLNTRLSGMPEFRLALNDRFFL